MNISESFIVERNPRLIEFHFFLNHRECRDKEAGAKPFRRRDSLSLLLIFCSWNEQSFVKRDIRDEHDVRDVMMSPSHFLLDSCRASTLQENDTT
ncbi:hypothetical protein Ddye_026394 [Dipteronia dyeriana]|uniref:Uncharacterized protein n=1 Tax=Dipteronia dyeriana TaxID=168575 RepID=A0AAD9TN23_9ROSI|nr:hypothetical protein Ddye_026394 [Dipteronia dyeriana]